jgi:hypothetical protein
VRKERGVYVERDKVNVERDRKECTWRERGVNVDREE